MLGGCKGRFFCRDSAQAAEKVQQTVVKAEDWPMYAIIQSGGKQYEAKPGKVVKMEKIPGEIGDQVVLNQVLLTTDGDQVQVGQPLLRDVSVYGRIVEQNRHRKVVIFKHKRRKDYRKKQGHRQYYTAVLVESINRVGEQQSLEVDSKE
jgi:large subunit ribosomal protein L21